MCNFNFACRFQKIEDGSTVITCRDLPELLSWAADGDTDEDWAKKAVEDCIAFRVQDGLEIPFASPAQEGEYIVELSTTEVVKVLIHNEMVKQNLTRLKLAEKSGLSLPEVTRLLNIKHKTKIDVLTETLKSIGKRLSFSLESM